MLEVGRIAKPHGVRGEVVVELTTERSERAAVGSTLHAEGHGLIRITASRPHQGKWLVTLEGVHDRSSAETLHGAKLFAEPVVDAGVLFAHDLIGAAVIDTKGAACGTVEAVQANPASDLLVLDSGALVPAVFLVEHRDDGVIVIDPPEGLLELNS
ncbi:MAG: ribosome maturation factor RimM [Acidimicrobiales bacterium]